MLYPYRYFGLITVELVLAAHVEEFCGASVMRPVKERCLRFGMT